MYTGAGATPSLLSSPEENSRTSCIGQRARRYFIIANQSVFFSAVDMSDTSNPRLSVGFISEGLSSNIATSAVVRWVCSLWPVAAVMRSSTVARPAKRKRGMNATETSVSVCQVGTRSRSICETPTKTLYLTLPQSCRFCLKTKRTFGLFQ